MTINEAIKIGANYLKGSDEAEPVEFDKFVKLGIEALKRVQKKRRGLYYSEVGLLPGETRY